MHRPIRYLEALRLGATAARFASSCWLPSLPREPGSALARRSERGERGRPTAGRVGVVVPNANARVRGRRTLGVELDQHGNARANMVDDPSAAERVLGR